MKHIAKLFAVLIGILCLYVQCLGITYSTAEMACPICNVRSTQTVLASYGSYVYGDPSRYQYVFFPMTGGIGYYTCDSCRFSCYREDLDSIPKNKIPLIKQELDNLPASEVQDKTVTALKTSARVYRILGRDDTFWCEYYRTLGYHLDECGMQQESSEARRQALYFAYKMFQTSKMAGKRKETLLICGTLEYLLGNTSKALQRFNDAIKLTYNDPNQSRREQKNMDEFLSELLKDYIDKIKSSSTIKPQRSEVREDR